MFTIRKRNNQLVFVAGVLLILVGGFLMLDDLCLHWIGYFGPQTGTILDTTVFEHWLYGVVLFVFGVTVTRISYGGTR
jgi:hypothetical protein